MSKAPAIAAFDPQPLREWLDPIPSLLDPFRLEDMRYRWRKRVVVPANWKTVVDAFVGIGAFDRLGLHT